MCPKISTSRNINTLKLKAIKAHPMEKARLQATGGSNRCSTSQQTLAEETWVCSLQLGAPFAIGRLTPCIVLNTTRARATERAECIMIGQKTGGFGHGDRHKSSQDAIFAEETETGKASTSNCEEGFPQLQAHQGSVEDPNDEGRSFFIDGVGAGDTPKFNRLQPRQAPNMLRRSERTRASSYATGPAGSDFLDFDTQGENTRSETRTGVCPATWCRSLLEIRRGET